MTKVRTWVGLDVHAAKVVACVVDALSGEMSVHRLPGETSALVAFCAGLPGATRVAYEAGPTGFGLARALTSSGIGCVIAAPGKIERPSADRVKTDQRDAERLVRLLMIDALHPVCVSSDEEEVIRDLVRAREDLRGDLMRARHRVSKLLLRHDVRYEDTTSAWTQRHRGWLASVELGERGAQATLSDYIGAIDALVLRRDTLEATIGEVIPGSPLADTVARLRCLRGLDTLSAVGLAAEIGDFTRFRAALAADELRRAGPVRAHQRAVPPPGRDHEDRLRARPPAPRRGRVALPPPATHRHHPPAPPRRSTPARGRDLLESPATPAPDLAAPRHPAREAPHTRRGRRRTAPRRVLLGNRQQQRRAVNFQHHQPRLRRRRNPPGPHAREHSRSYYEQPHQRSRSMLDSELSRRNPVLRYPTREYQ
jgi:transposase